MEAGLEEAKETSWPKMDSSIASDAVHVRAILPGFVRSADTLQLASDVLAPSFVLCSSYMLSLAHFSDKGLALTLTGRLPSLPPITRALTTPSPPPP